MTHNDFNTQLQQAQNFIWSNARLLERYLFAYLFSNGSKEPVLTALRAYQNPDGGFGNALEPDKRCPNSQPVDVEEAFHILDHLNAFTDPMVQQACDYLQTITTNEGGVPFSLPTLNSYPHAPWWTAPAQPEASLNPTAAIAGLLHKHHIQHPWLDTATAYCWRTIESTNTAEFHTIKCIITFLEHVPETERAQHEIQRIIQHLQHSDAITYDTNTSGYVQPPLDWAPTPHSPLHALFNDDTINTHLTILAAQQQSDGGWPISWEPVSKFVETEWRSIVTIRTLLTLRSYL